MFNKVLEDYFGNGFNNYVYREKKRQREHGIQIDKNAYEIKQVNIVIRLNNNSQWRFPIGKHLPEENVSPLELEILLDVVRRQAREFKLTYEFAKGLPSNADKVFLIYLDSKEADVDKLSAILESTSNSLSKYRKSLERTIYGKEK